MKKILIINLIVTIVVISLKIYTFYITDSVGFMSDTIESLFNIFTAAVSITALYISIKPEDKEHNFGHGKAEYFSSIISGIFVIIAAIIIIYSSITRLLNLKELSNINIGITISLLATLLNIILGYFLIKKGKENNSIILESEGKHLYTDVITTIGVIIGIVLVKITGLLIIDPIIGILVAINISYTGYKIIVKSTNGLMDISLPADKMELIISYLENIKKNNIDYHSLKSRISGQRIFITFHILVPGDWSIQEGHDFADKIEKDIEDIFKCPINVSSHLEPIEDPSSMEDISIDRKKRVV